MLEGLEGWMPIAKSAWTIYALCLALSMQFEFVKALLLLKYKGFILVI